MTRGRLLSLMGLLSLLGLALIGLRPPTPAREHDDPLTTRDGWGWS